MNNGKNATTNHPLLPTHHTMKRRANFHDYNGQGAYLLTLAVEGRRPLLGMLILGDEATEHRKPPYVELTELGEKILKEEIRKISLFYPQVEVWRVCIMPDHLHMILRVKEDLPKGKHLGHIIMGFKTGCNKAYYSGNEAARHGKQTLGDKTAEHGKQTLGDKTAEHGKQTLGDKAAEHGKQTLGDKTAEHGKQPPVLCGSVAQEPPRKGLFEPGYNDRLLFDGEQLERWKHYLDDNPRRLALKRLHPDLFTVKRGMRIANHDCQIIGNQFLLDIPDKMAVIVHRRYSEEEYQRLTEQWLACGERGGVLVSAAISPKEKAVLKEARERGYNIIWLNENGFPEFYKPTGKAFDACSSGQLLQICPWQYHTEQRTISREQCLELNAMAIEIAGE